MSEKIDPAKGAQSDAVTVVESGTLRPERRVPVPAVNIVNEDLFETRRLKDNFAYKSTYKLNVVCMLHVMSTYMKFVCPYCLQTSHKVSQSIGLFGAQAPLGRFLHSGDSPVFGGAFN